MYSLDALFVLVKIFKFFENESNLLRENLISVIEDLYLISFQRILCNRNL